MEDMSNFIVYVDESGDHGLGSIDPNYPVFVLAFCIFNKQDYITKIIPPLQQLKFKYFGHDMVIFHEYDIRKAHKEFSILLNAKTRADFIRDLSRVVEDGPFTLIATVIKKEALNDKYTRPENPYHMAMGFGLERVYRYLESKGEHGKITHVVFEKRGRREDNELELEFRRVCDGANYFNKSLPFNIVFADKKANSSGLQFADLLARPIGRAVLNPEQENRAYDIIKKKFYASDSGKIEGWGLKCFP